MAASAGLFRHPQVRVKVQRERSRSPTSVQAVVDTGAMMCVAGLELL